MAIPLATAIRIPVRNPRQVVGFLVDLNCSPFNNIVRFVLVVGLPLAAALLALRVGRRDAGESGGEPREDGAGEQPEGAERTQDVAGRAPRSRDPRLLGAAFAVALATWLVVPTPGASGPLDTFHEGEALGAATSWIHGGVPYRDFLPIHGLFEDPLRVVSAWELFGRSVGAFRTFESLRSLLAWILALLLVHRLTCGSAQGTLLGMLALFVVCALPRLHPDVEGNLVALWNRDLLPLIFLLLVGRLARGEAARPGRGALLGALLAAVPTVAFAVSVDRAIYLSTAWLLLVPVTWLFVISRTPSRWAFPAGSLAGGAAGLAVVAAALGEGRGPFVRYVFGELPAVKDLMDGQVYPLDRPRFLLPLVALAIAGVVFLAGALVRRRAERWIADHGLDLATLLLALFSFRNVLNRADATHLAYSTPLLAIWLAARFGRWGATECDASPLRRLASRLVPVATTVVLLATIAHVAIRPVLSSKFPLGKGDEEFLDAETRRTLGFLRQQPIEAGRFYTMTSEAAWYYLLDAPPPTRFQLSWFAVTPEWEEELLGDLSRGRIEWVLRSNGHWGNAIDGIGNERRVPRLLHWLDREFEPAWSDGTSEVWRRRDVAR